MANPRAVARGFLPESLKPPLRHRAGAIFEACGYDVEFDTVEHASERVRLLVVGTLAVSPRTDGPGS